MDLRAVKNDIQEDRDQVLPIGDVAKLLGVAPRTLRRWDAIGILLAIRLYPGSRRYYRKIDVMTLITKKSIISNVAKKEASIPKPHLIYLKDFGTVLESADGGRTAWRNFQPTLETIPLNTIVEIDFSDVTYFYPQWAEQFLVPLHAIYGDNIEMTHIEKAHFVTTLEILGLYQDPYRSY